DVERLYRECPGKVQSGRGPQGPCSERNLVVHVRGAAAALRAAAARGTAAIAAAPAARATARTATALAAVIVIAAAAVVIAALATAAPAFAAAAEQRQLAAELAQHDLGGIAVLARLVLPFAGFQRTLDIDRAALAQVLLGD